MEVKINSFAGPGLRDGEWAELLSFSATNNYEGSSGDRVPGVFSHRDGSILVATQVQCEALCLVIPEYPCPGGRGGGLAPVRGSECGDLVHPGAGAVPAGRQGGGWSLTALS